MCIHIAWNDYQIAFRRGLGGNVLHTGILVLVVVQGVKIRYGETVQPSAGIVGIKQLIDLQHIGAYVKIESHGSVPQQCPSEAADRTFC